MKHTVIVTTTYRLQKNLHLQVWSHKTMSTIEISLWCSFLRNCWKKEVSWTFCSQCPCPSFVSDNSEFDAVSRFMYWPFTKIAQRNVCKTWTCKYLAITSINLLHMNIKCIVNTSVLLTRIRHTSVKCKVFIVIHCQIWCISKEAQMLSHLVKHCLF